MKKILAVVSFALVTIFAGCNKEDKLWDAIDALKNRVEALETQVKQLNTNVDALAQLHKDGSTVLSTEQDPLTGTWKIKLSNGVVIDLKQGTDATATIPVMAINDAGNWEVSYDNGVTFKEITRDGQPVKAETTAPLFRVDNDGFWQVSYDGGVKYDFVLNEANQKVYAFKDGAPTDSFFTSVDVVDGELVIVMKNGEKLSVPVVKDFFCIIKDAPVDPVKFDAGDVKMYTVELKGVDNTIIIAPEGWKAKLGPESNGSATLTITAPATTPIASKAATADTNKDVAIIATSNKYTAIAKLQVELVGSGEVAPPTITSVAENAASKTASSLTFDVVVSTDAAGVKYICQLANAQAPTIQNVIDNGTAVVKTSLPITVDNLLPLTAYKIYVVAYKGTGTITYGEAVISAEATTNTDVVDYYEEGVTIGGVTYSKDNGTLLEVPADASANVEITTGASTSARIFFLDTPKHATFTYTLPNASIVVDADVVIIGRYSNSKIKVASQTSSIINMKNSGGSSSLVLKNIDVDLTTRANYLLNNSPATASMKLLYIEDCKFTTGKSFVYMNAPQVGVNDIVFRNNIFKITATGVQIFPTAATKKFENYRSFTFENNILYGADASAAYTTGIVLNYGNGTKQDVGTVVDFSLVVRNNTFANFGGESVMFKFPYAKVLDISKNIFYSLQSNAKTNYLYSEYKTDLDPATNYVEPTPIIDNVVYGGGTWNNYHGNSTLKIPAVNLIEKADSDPFTSINLVSGIFVRSSAMIAGGYGSSLK